MSRGGEFVMNQTGVHREAEVEDFVSEVFRPAALVPERAARAITASLGNDAVSVGGVWLTTPTTWTRYDRPWESRDRRGHARVVGRVYVAFETPSRYAINIYRATISQHGAHLGWTVGALCDDALRPGGLTFGTCPRVIMRPPPKPFRPAGDPVAARRQYDEQSQAE
jgi:hypothetical protein